MNRFPYTNFHELNLDWLINVTRKNETDISELKSLLPEISGEINLTSMNNRIGENERAITEINGEIENHDQAITELDDKIDESVATLNRTIENKEEELSSSIEDVAASIPSRVETALDAALSENTAPDFYRRAIIFCCDSYGAHQEDWKQFPELIAEKLSGVAPVINISRGSTGVTGGANGTHLSTFTAREANFPTLFNDAGWSDVFSTPYSANNVTDIFIGCGHNDNSNTESQLITGVRSFCEYVETNYPNATVWVIFASCDLNRENSGSASVRARTYNVYKAYSSANGIKNARFVDLGGVFASAQLMRDNVHPNAEGSKVIANALFGEMCGVRYPVTARAKFTTSSNLSTSGQTLNLETTVIPGGKLMAVFSGISYVTFNEPLMPSAGSTSASAWTKIADFDSGDAYWFDNTSAIKAATFLTVMRGSNNTYGTGFCRINIDANGDVYVQVIPSMTGHASVGVSVIYLPNPVIIQNLFA